MRRHHIGGELPGNSGAEEVLLYLRRCDIIGAQVCLAVAFRETLDGGVRNPVNRLDDCLDLTGFHALAVDLDHPVHPVDIDQAAFLIPPAEVSGPQQAFMTILRSERIRDDPFRRKLRQADIAGQQMPGDADFAFVDLIAVLIQDIDRNAVQRVPERGTVVGFVDQETGYGGGGLRHTVGIHDRVAPRRDAGHPFGARGHHPEGLSGFPENLQDFRGQVGPGDAHPVDEQGEFPRVHDDFPGDRRHARAAGQRVHRGNHAGDKGKGRHQTGNIIRFRLQDGLPARDGIVEALLVVQNSLGFAGRTGGVDDHGRSVFRHFPVFGFLRPGQNLLQHGRADDDLRADVLCRVSDPVLRIAGIHGNRAETEQETGGFHDDIGNGLRQRDDRIIPGVHPLGPKIAGDGGSPVIKLRIGQAVPASGVNDRSPVRMGPHGFIKKALDGVHNAPPASLFLTHNAMFRYQDYTLTDRFCPWKPDRFRSIHKRN